MQTMARAVAALAAGALMLSGAVRAQQPDTSFERWSRTRAVPVHTVEPGHDIADLRPLKTIIGAARVVALGEPAHGAHEPLAFRNRLFQYLVLELGFTAMVIESGLSESRRIHQFVLGGEGTAAVVARENLSWGFGTFQENEQLLQWIRDYNADPSHRRKIHFYGMDLSLGGPTGSTPTPAPIEAALGTSPGWMLPVPAVSRHRWSRSWLACRAGRR